MCLIAFAIGANARWPLVIAANRDEAYARPSAGLARWTGPRGHSIVSGRDLRDGGAWLGVSESGRVAMLTNVRAGTPQTGARSRGELVSRWLDGDEDFAAYCQALQLHSSADAFAGFNLVTGDCQRQAWHWVSNRSHGQRSVHTCGLQTRQLQPGIYGLSNAALDTPWPKTLALKSALLGSLAALDFDGLVAQLMPALLNSQSAAVQDLPDTGIAPELELVLSSAFVRSPSYGTCSSAIIGVGSTGPGTAGKLDFLEHSHLAPAQERKLSLRWPAIA